MAFEANDQRLQSNGPCFDEASSVQVGHTSELALDHEEEFS